MKENNVSVSCPIQKIRKGQPLELSGSLKSFKGTVSYIDLAEKSSVCFGLKIADKTYDVCLYVEGKKLEGTLVLPNMKQPFCINYGPYWTDFQEQAKAEFRTENGLISGRISKIREVTTEDDVELYFRSIDGTMYFVRYHFVTRKGKMSLVQT